MRGSAQTVPPELPAYDFKFSLVKTYCGRRADAVKGIYTVLCTLHGAITISRRH